MSTQAAHTGHCVTLQLWHSCLSGVQGHSGRSKLQLLLVEVLPWPEPSTVPKEDSVVRDTKDNSLLGWVFILVFLSKAEPIP